MTRSKLKKKWKSLGETQLNDEDNNAVIKGLPKKFIWMKVNSGTKIRNVLGYALKSFSEFGCIMWTAAGQGIGKAISCVEIFKRNNPGLHQITKLRYIDSKNVSTAVKQVPEINIFLSKEAIDCSEPGYQGPGDLGMFQNSSINDDSPNELRQGQGSKSRMSSMAMEEFSTLELRTGQKRPRKDQPDNKTPIIKKGKKQINQS